MKKKMKQNIFPIPLADTPGSRESLGVALLTLQPSAFQKVVLK